jgi:hypothetical protein
MCKLAPAILYLYILQVESNLALISECGELDLLRCAHQLQLQNVEGENQDSMHEFDELEK